MCQYNTAIRRKFSSNIHGILWIYCEFRSEYQVQLSPQFSPPPLPFSSILANSVQNPTEIRGGQTQIRVSLTRFIHLKI